jgi:hypothetical protein
MKVERCTLKSMQLGGFFPSCVYLEAICLDINVTATHIELIHETSCRAGELGQAKAI